MSEFNIAIVAAAGRSRRMGFDKRFTAPRPLLPVTLNNIQRAYDLVVVVVRPDDEITADIQSRERVFVKVEGDESLGASIASGARYVRSHYPDSDVAVHLADMPYLTAAHCMYLRSAHKGGITLPVYEGKRGHPVIFSGQFLDELCQLNKVEGAKQLLSRYSNQVTQVSVATDAVLKDIDVKDDWNSWLRANNERKCH